MQRLRPLPRHPDPPAPVGQRWEGTSRGVWGGRAGSREGEGTATSVWLHRHICFLISYVPVARNSLEETRSRRGQPGAHSPTRQMAEVAFVSNCVLRRAAVEREFQVRLSDGDWDWVLLSLLRAVVPCALACCAPLLLVVSFVVLFCSSSASSTTVCSSAPGCSWDCVLVVILGCCAPGLLRAILSWAVVRPCVWYSSSASSSTVRSSAPGC